MPISVSDLYVEVVPDFVVLHPVQFELLEWLLYLVAELVVVVQEELLLGAELEYHLLLQLWTGLGVVFQDSQLVPQLVCELVVLFQDLVLVVVIADCSQLVAELVAPLGLVDNHFFYDLFVCISHAFF